MDHFKQLFTLITCVGLFCLSGCLGSNSDIGYVTGTITIDGKPIHNATVSFIPTTGRGSLGQTDANGYYELGYVRNQKGALIGNHKVMIQTDIAIGGDYDFRTREEKIADKEAGKAVSDSGKPIARKEMLPKKYCDRKETELTATVKSGNNTFDWDLTTE
jgi:hypothetical protein